LCIYSIPLGTDHFSDLIHNAIIQDLLCLNEQLCILAVQWRDNTEAILAEAQDLQIQSVLIRFVAHLMWHLVASELLEGDIVCLSALNDWYCFFHKELCKTPKSHFLFNPTKLASGLIQHLTYTLKTENKFDVNQKPKPLIPLSHLRNWAEELQVRINTGTIDNIIVRMLQ